LITVSIMSRGAGSVGVSARPAFQTTDSTSGNDRNTASRTFRSSATLGAETLGIVTGMVAGLGTITPASGFVGPMGAIVIGVAAGATCYAATQFLKRRLKIDDSLDVFPVHGVGGLLGTVLTGVFVASALGGAGLPEGGTIGGQVLVQLTGVVATLAWSGILTFLILKALDATLGLRVSAEDETQGLDVAMHEERGYIL
jgi:Amt family ammonium transporter